MPFAVNPEPFRTDTITAFDPATDTPETKPEESPAFFSEVVPAAFRTQNSVTSYLASTAPVLFKDDWDKNYDVFNDMAGYEDYADRLAVARNADHAAQIKQDINTENESRRILGSAGGLGVVAELAAGFGSPEMLLPAGEISTAAGEGYNLLRVGADTAKSAAVAMTLQEANLHASQQTRTGMESAVNIGAGTFLAGLMGAGAAHFLGPEALGEVAGRTAQDMNITKTPDAVDEVGDEIDALKESSVGAMQAPRQTMDQNTLKSALGSVTMTKGLNVSPAVRLLTSPSLASREVFQQLAENPLFMKKNAEGVASDQAVETYVKQYNSLLGQSTGELDKQYAAYRTSVKGQKTRLSYEQFKAEVSGALRRGDTHAIPQVEASARAYRPLLDRMKDEAISAGMLPEDVEPKFAQSYLQRMWDRNKILLQEKDFRGTIRDWANDKSTKVMRYAMADYNRQINNMRAEVADLEMQNLRQESASQKVPKAEGPTLEEHVRHTINKTFEGENGNVLLASKDNYRLQPVFSDDGVKRWRLSSINDQSIYPARTIDEAELRDFLATKHAEPKKVEASADEVNSMMAQMRNNPAPKRPQSLVQFLHAKGGLKDEDALLKTQGITNKARVGFVSKKGMTLEQASELAFNEGFYPGRKAKPDINVLMGDIRDELSGMGGKVREKDAATLKAAEEHADMLRALHEMGIDTSDLPGGREPPKGGKPEDLSGLREKVNKLTRDRRERRAAMLKEKIAEIEAERHVQLDTRFDVGNNMEHYLDEVVDNVFNTLTGRENVDLEDGFVVSTRGPLRAKALDIEDQLVEKYLNNDIDMIARKHVRTIAADVELKRKFGDTTMEGQLDQIREEYNKLRQQHPDQAAKLAKREKSDIEDLEMMRDLLRGTHVDDTGAGWKRAGRLARAWNYVSKMGMVVPSSFADVARPVMVHGINRVFGDLLLPMAKGLKGIKLQADEGRLAGHIFETVLSARQMELSDLNDPFAQGSAFERWVHHNLVPAFSKLTLMNRWNDVMKAGASALTQSRLLENTETLLKSGKLAPNEREYLNFLGIDKDMALRIGEEFKEHGQVVDGVRVANTGRWGNGEAVRVFRAALNKEVDNMIVQPGIADRPMFMNRELGKTMLQFRTFFFASNQRVMMRGLQQRDAAMLNGTLLSVAVGMLTAHIKASLRGDDTSQWPAAKWIAEGVDQSGIMPVLVELNNTWEKLGLPGLYTALGQAPSSRYKSRNEMGALMGPTFALGQDATQLFPMLRHPESMTRNDIRVIRRLIPFQNLFYMRWAFNKMEDATAKAAGAN